MLQKLLQLFPLFHMPQAGAVHLSIFIKPVDCFIPGDSPEVFVVRKDVFLVFDGEKHSFVHIIKYENLSYSFVGRNNYSKVKLRNEME